MSSQSAIRAGRAFVEIFADDSKAQKVLKRFERRMQAFGASIRALGTSMFTAGAGLLVPLVGATKVFSEMGDSLAKMSSRTGISVEALSELGYAAEQSGTDLQALELGVRTMQRVLDEAARGSQSAALSLARLGLSIRDLQGLSPDEQFTLLADRLSRIPDPAQRAALAMKLFGRGGAALLPLMQAGAKGIDELRDAARRLGLVISTEDAKAAEEFGDRMSDLWKVLKVSTFQVGAALAPAMVRLARIITGAAKVTADWLKQNRAAVVTVAAVAAGVAGAGLALIGFGTAITIAGAGVGLLAKSLVWVGALAGGLKVAIAALLTPLGLVGVALGGLGVYMLHSSGVIDQAINGIKTLFRDLTADMLMGWQGVVDAISAGEIGLAFEIVAKTGRLAWANLMGFFQGSLTEFGSFANQVWIEATSNLSGAFVNSFYGIQSGWVMTTRAMQDVFNSMLETLRSGWQKASNWMAGVMVRVMAAFDPSINADDVLKELDAIHQHEMKGIADASATRREAIQADREQQLAAIDQNRLGALDANEQMRENRTQAYSAGRDAHLKSLQADLDAARAELDRLAKQAAGRRASEQVDSSGRERKRPELPSEEQMFAAGSSVMGTFSAAAASGLGAGRDWGQTIASNTEKTAGAVEELVKQQTIGGGFA